MARMRSDPHSLRVVDYVWAKDAACRGVGPDIFFDSDPEAYNYCYRCPVTTQCADYAHENHLLGIWGGLSERQRSLGVRYMPVARPLKEDQSDLANQIWALHRQGMSWIQISKVTGVHYRNLARFLARKRAS